MESGLDTFLDDPHFFYRVVAFTETGVSDKDTVGNFAPDLTFMEMDIAHGMTAR